MNIDIRKILVKTKNIFCGEVIFAAFILAGNFKSALTFIPSSIDITVLFLLLSMLIGIKRLYIKSTLLKGSLEAIILYSIFSVLLLGSLLYTLGNIYAFDKAFRFLIITGWSYLGVFFLLRSDVSIKKFLNSIVSIAVIMSGFALYQFFTSSGLNFVKVLGSGYLALGRTLGISILITVILYFINENKKIKSLFIILIILQMIIALLLSGGRTPFIALLIVFTLYLTFSFKTSFKKIFLRKGTKKIVFFIALIIPIIFILANLGTFDVMIVRLTELINDSGGGTSANARWIRYETAIDMCAESPILGKGIGSFPIFYSGTDIRDYPHNIFLEITSELGILGLIAFLLIVSFCLYCGFILYKRKFKIIDSLQMTLILVFLYLIINANISGDLNDNRLMFTFISLLSISPYIERKVGDKNENLYINKRT